GAGGVRGPVGGGRGGLGGLPGRAAHGVGRLRRAGAAERGPGAPAEVRGGARARRRRPA
ncbi:unnamed protein product, partial [Heterosigma akashiwo]